MTFDLVYTIGLLVTAVLAALAGVLFLAVLQGHEDEAAPQGVFTDPGKGAEFIFDGEELVDATPVARSLLPKGNRRPAATYARLTSYLEPRFPNVAERLRLLEAEGSLMMTSLEGAGTALLLRADLRGGLTHISLIDPEGQTEGREGDSLTRRAVQEELDQLRITMTRAPLPVWRETGSGDVVWANARYLDLVAEKLEPGEDLSWPLPRLFERTASAQGAKGQRQKVTFQPDVPVKWFDLHGTDEPDGRLVFALPADSTVQAEASLRAFMQTLTKTFAQLPTGLAIFDDQRKLAMFNPALIDITGLPPELLSARPTFLTFFDAMREKSMIPEPRDYRSWRSQITDLEKAASDGLYTETWSLPGGQTVRVTGRPHPNGSLALLFEDISTEITQTRRFRADLELGQAVIDAMDEAIAVFSSAGVLVMSNAAYSDLWGHDPAASLGAEGSIATVCEHWRALSSPSTLWDRAEDFISTFGAREAWHDQTHLAEGQLVLCRFSPLAGGATLAGFRAVAQNEDRDPVFSSSRKSA